MDRLSASLACAAGTIGCSEIEARINEILRQEWNALSSNPERKAYYSAIFEQTVEGGFYSDPRRSNRDGEAPTSDPNEAYIRCHEEMWEKVDVYLSSLPLALETGFRELFPSSREYEDSETEHRRVFRGRLCDSAGRPVATFALTVPHSHQRFRISAPMQLALAKIEPRHAHTRVGDDGR